MVAAPPGRAYPAVVDSVKGQPARLEWPTGRLRAEELSDVPSGLNLPDRDQTCCGPATAAAAPVPSGLHTHRTAPGSPWATSRQFRAKVRVRVGQGWPRPRRSPPGSEPTVPATRRACAGWPRSRRSPRAVPPAGVVDAGWRDDGGELIATVLVDAVAPPAQDGLVGLSRIVPGRAGWSSLLIGRSHAARWRRCDDGDGSGYARPPGEILAAATASGRRPREACLRPTAGRDVSVAGAWPADRAQPGTGRIGTGTPTVPVLRNASQERGRGSTHRDERAGAGKGPGWRRRAT